LRSSLVKEENNLTPVTKKVKTIFAKSQKIWQSYLKKAQLIMSLPINSLKASNLLYRIPAFSANLRDCWFVNGHST
jgi:hypothetical protein